MHRLSALFTCRGAVRGLRARTSALTATPSTGTTICQPSRPSGPGGQLHHYWFDRAGLCFVVGGSTHSGISRRLQPDAVFADAHFVDCAGNIEADRYADLSAMAHAVIG